MGEFKATKLKEEEKFSFAFDILYPNWDDKDVIEYREQKEVKAFQIGYNQALEDSKAPEMLELLQEIDHFLNCDFNVGEKHTKIKQLIKEITEI